MAKWSSQHNGKFPDPYSKLKLDEEKKVKKKKKKKDKSRDVDSILSQLDPNVTNKVRLRFHTNSLIACLQLCKRAKFILDDTLKKHACEKNCTLISFSLVV